MLSSMKSGVGGFKEDDDPLTASSRPTCPVCRSNFTFPSQLRRHVRHQHPDFDAQLLPQRSAAFIPKKKYDGNQLEMEEEASADDQPHLYNLKCSWCDQDYSVKEEYDEHLKEHGEQAYNNYIEALECKSDLPTKESSTVDEADPACKSENDSKREPSIECTFCGVSNKGEWALQQHLDSCHKESSRICRLCDEHCLDATSLREHLIHHFHGIIQCPVCSIRFSVRHHLVAHFKVCHSSGYIIYCHECKCEFDNFENYEMHQVECHGIGAFRECKICGKKVLTFDYYKHFEDHGPELKSSVGSGSLSCNMCSLTFEYAPQLYQHKYQEHPDAFSFKCDECEHRCKTERMLAVHKWGHKYGSHCCPVCKLKYRRVDQLKKHLLSSHPDHEGYSCKYCPLTLKNYATYVAHLKLKHPRESGYNKPVRCKICGESFDHKTQWKYHMRNHSQLLHKCMICGISVKNLDVHMNLHTKTKKFECKICGAIYHNKASFHFHVKRVHMGESVRKFLCEICGKGFLTPADQRIHITRVHQGERNYWCSTCNKGYKSRVSLTYHERLHTGEKPHKCTLCGRTFRVPSYLKRHMEHNHRTRYPGVYFKQGRPKTQEARGQIRRQPQKQSCEPGTNVNLGQANGSIPEIVQITVPMEMGDEVVAAVNSVQGSQYKVEQDGIVYVVCEKFDV